MQGERVIAASASSTATSTGTQHEPEHGDGHLDWQTVDRALRTIARARAALDADEARWLREAEKLEIWRPLGMVSALDYLERVLGYAPRTAQDRLRVARALGTLPSLSGALARGELTFSGARELTRVATPGTEAEWLRAASGMTLRQIEELVADHRPGDRPDDPPDPQARQRVVRFELSAGTFARLRQARIVVDNEHGQCLDDDTFVAALCDAVLDGTAPGEPSGRARYQIAMTVCARCRQGWQDGGGAQVPVDTATVERALCDAQHIGSLDGETPERAHQDVPPSVARLVWRRDGGRCRVPGCRSARGLELHHLVHRADGGGHDASNLILACSSCHQAHHAGTLTITGTADCIAIRRAGETATAPCVDVDASAVAAAAGGDAATTGTNTFGRMAETSPVAEAVPVAASPSAPSAPPTARDTAPVQPSHGGAAASPLLHSEPVAAREAISAAAHVGASRSRLDLVVLRTQVKEALRTLGWSAAIAQAAVTAAAAVLGPDASLEHWIREALRRCPRPVTHPT